MRSLTECPENVFIGFSNPTLQTATVVSVEHVAKLELFCQSISNTGPAQMKTYLASTSDRVIIMNEHYVMEFAIRNHSKETLWFDC